MSLNKVRQAMAYQNVNGHGNLPLARATASDPSHGDVHGSEVIDLPVTGYGKMPILVDAVHIEEILAQRWSIGYDHRPVTFDETSRQVVSLHRWLRDIGNDRSRCVLFLNRNDRDFRLANLVNISKSLLCRGYDPRNPNLDWPGSSIRNIRITESERFKVVIGYRMRFIHAPICETLMEAQLIKRYILWRIEPDLQTLIGDFHLPAQISERYQERIEQKIIRIETMENPPVTPFPNIYRSQSVNVTSYRYCFHFYGQRHAVRGFRTLEDAVQAYNERVMAITGDPTRLRALGPYPLQRS